MGKQLGHFLCDPLSEQSATFPCLLPLLLDQFFQLEIQTLYPVPWPGLQASDPGFQTLPSAFRINLQFLWLVVHALKFCLASTVVVVHLGNHGQSKNTRLCPEHNTPIW